MISLFALVYALCFCRNVFSQSSICLWDIISNEFNISAMNGIYTDSGEYENMRYFTKPGKSCHSVYHMYFVQGTRDWNVYTSLDNTNDWARCQPSTGTDITSCPQWEVYDISNRHHNWDSNVFTRLDSCPTWNCDQISIPSLSGPCNNTFDVNLGNNIWKNSFNNLHWSFNPLYFRWQCDDSYPDFCDDASLAYTDSGWTDLENGTAFKPLQFTVPNHASYDVYCIADLPTNPPSSAPSRNPIISSISTSVASTHPPSASSSNPPFTSSTADTRHTTNAPPTAPSNVPSTIPSVSPVTPSPIHKPSKNPSFHPTRRIVWNGTVMNVTVTVDDPNDIKHAMNTLNDTVFSFLVANDITTSLQTDIIEHGTTVIAIYAFRNHLDTNVIDAKAIEAQISQDLDDNYHGNTNVKVNVSADPRAEDGGVNNGAQDPMNTDVWIAVSIAAFAVCVIVMICFYFSKRRKSNISENKNDENRKQVKLQPHVSNDSLCGVAPGATGGEPGGRDPQLVMAEKKSSDDSSIENSDDLYVVHPEQNRTIEGNTQNGDKEEVDEDEDDDDDLNKLYDKAHKTPDAMAGDETALVETEGIKEGEDNNEEEETVTKQ